MDKYIGFDVDGKQTPGGNRQTRNRQNGFHLSPLPKFLDHSHQPARGALARALRPLKWPHFAQSAPTTGLQPESPLSANSAKNVNLISAVLSVSCEEVKNCATYSMTDSYFHFICHRCFLCEGGRTWSQDCT